jgi:hypothetical protein
LIVEVMADLRSPAPWYLKSITSWVIVMAGACLLFARFWEALRRQGVDPGAAIFNELPPE